MTRCQDDTSNLFYFAQVHLIPRTCVIFLATPCALGLHNTLEFRPNETVVWGNWMPMLSCEDCSKEWMLKTDWYFLKSADPGWLLNQQQKSSVLLRFTVSKRDKWVKTVLSQEAALDGASLSAMTTLNLCITVSHTQAILNWRNHAPSHQTVGQVHHCEPMKPFEHQLKLQQVSGRCPSQQTAHEQEHEVAGSTHPANLHWMR